MPSKMGSRSFTTISERSPSHRKTPRSEQPNTFVAIDGEGMTNAYGQHTYVLLGLGSDQISNANGLDWRTIFGFLYDHFSPRTTYCGFYLGYDFTQWLKTLPEDKAWLLLTSEGQAKRARNKSGGNHRPFPVNHDGWEFDILGNKRLCIRPRYCDCAMQHTCGQKQPPWMFICDVGHFFQCSFLKVIDPNGWDGSCPVTADEYETIRQGKELRSTAVLGPDMMRYNALENEILQRVMAIMDEGFLELGIKLGPSTYHGPGQAAQSWMRSEKIISTEQLEKCCPQWALDAAAASYFGGWFEIMMHGIIPGDCYEYDVNSAYPFVIATLPCLEHGTWTEGIGYPDELENGDLCLVQARVWTASPEDWDKAHYIGAMLHRTKKGTVKRPLATEGWYWWHELQAAISADCVENISPVPESATSPQVFKWIRYQPCDCFPPLRRVENLYAKRLAVGKNTPLGKAAKLVYNSMYGKFAQSIGHPVYGNPIYASLITAGCRTQILDAIATHPKGKSDVAMVATDGVYFRTPHNSLPISNKLGEWESTKRRNLTLFKPGVYWDDEARRRIATGKNPNLKARGVNGSDFGGIIAGVDTEYRTWRSTGKARTIYAAPPHDWPSVQLVLSFSMTSALLAIRRNKWWTAGSVRDETDEKNRVVQSSNPATKRFGWWYDNGADAYRSEPHRPELPSDNVWEELQSYPYEKRFGMEDPFSQESREQFGISPDSENIGDEWYRVILNADLR